MSFVILRTAKLKTAGEIGGSLGHTFRVMETPNADKTKNDLNEHDFSLEEIKENIKNRLPENVRKNGVRVVEYLISASPEWKGWGTDAVAEFFDNAKKWLREKHGAENVAGLSIHRDETSPHLIAYVIPIDPEGRLNARHFLGGRKLLSEMQTDFADRVKHIGLERGVEGSRAKHTTVKEFYAEIQKPVKAPTEIQLTRLEKQPVSPMFTRNEIHGEKVIDAVYSHIAPEFEQYENQMRAEFSALTAQLSSEKFKNKKLQKQVSELTNVGKILKNVISENDQEFEVFQELKNRSEEKYQDLKKHAQTQIDAELQKENDRLSFTVTPKTEIEKQLESDFKNIKISGPVVDQGAQQEKKKEKGSENNLGL
jgi:hypothetical protein